MTRLTTLKISLFSALTTLFLLVAMLASTGTASAHTVSKQATAFPHPQIEVTDVVPMGGNCEKINLVGFGFFPGHVQLEAFQQGYSASVQPAFFKTNGSFSRHVTICGDFGWDYGLGWGPGFGWSHHHHHHHGWGPGYGWGYAPTVLTAIGPLGLQSNSVTLQ
jgi:hypothetical protein